VSAYLHSATMVKAGIYLLLRLNPVLGGTDAWHYVITLTGALTMLTGALLALPQTDLKRILAYTTVSTLGALVLLIGLDTSQAVKAALVLLLVHALYKGALFLAAGILDHETGTRDIERLGGLARAMPITATASVLAALSMAGLPPLFGFIGKELLYEAKTQAPSAAWLVTSAGLLANVLVFAASGLVALRPFFGRRPESTREVHEAGPGLWLGPVVLAIAGLLLGVLPNTTFGPLLEAALGAVRAETTAIELALWHGLNPILLLSLATVGAGAALYLLRGPALAALAPLRPLLALGPARAYAWGLEALVATAKATAALLQGGSLRHHVAVVVAVTLGLAGGALLTHGATFVGPDFTDLLPHETLLAALLLAGAVATALFASRLAAVAALGVVGLAVALTFLLFGGPDLAMTQLAVETLSVILFVFVVYRLPRFARLSSTATRLRDLALAIAGGALMTVLVWTASAGASGSVLSEYFARASAPEAKGRNVVNVILVDFRALDTLGEITVLATAALGVFALLRLRPSGGRS